MNRAALALLVAMLVFAPIFRAGRIPESLMVLELLALPLLVLCVVPGFVALSRWSRVALVLLCATPALQLVPLPFALWSALPGGAARAADLAAAGVSPAFLPLSLTPSATESALWSLLPVVAALCAALAIDARSLRIAVWVFLGVAALEGLLALAQFQQSEESALRFGMNWLASAGTYTNRNHLAGLLEMALPIALGLLAASLEHHHADRGLRLAGLRALPLLVAATSAAILLGLLFSRSRAGLLLALLGVAVSAIVFGRRVVSRYVRGALGSVLAVALVVVVLVGALPVLERLTTHEAVADLRWQTARNTWDLAREHLPFGSGAGSFEMVYAPRQPMDEGAWVRMNAAHDDYLQALLEGGMPWALAIAAALVAYARRWRERTSVIATGAGIGVGLLALHELVDYNLQVPANAMFFAFLCGVFLRRDHVS